LLPKGGYKGAASPGRPSATRSAARRLMSALSDKGLGVVAPAGNWNTVTALLRLADSVT
jgi:hypothetical protein